MRPGVVLLLLWEAWALSWLAAAFWSARTVARVATTKVWLYRLLTLAGAVLLWHRTGERLGLARLWHVGRDGAWLLTAVALAGFLFAWWARLYLGRLWSGNVARKEGHRVVDTGPYRLVRHPIYTGLLLSTAATALVVANAAALAGALLIGVGLWVKARTEERFLSAELGQGDYDAYRRRVPMLVPFLPAGTQR